jgi:hypothetical protein
VPYRLHLERTNTDVAAATAVDRHHRSS